MTIQERIKQALDDLATAPQPIDLADRALRAARRRRATNVGAGIAAGGVVLALAAAGLAGHGSGAMPVGGTGRNSDQWRAASATSNPATVNPSPFACPPSVPQCTNDPKFRATGPKGQIDFDVFATLTRLLPLDSSTEAITDPLTQLGFAAVNITDPQGTTRLSVNVELGMTDEVGPLIDCAAREVPAGTQCTVTTLPGGARMLASDGPNVDGLGSVRELLVDLLYPDGRRVAVGEWNAADEKRGAVSRPAPLLTLDQLVTLATAPDWLM
jgi:hypothetical protein